MNWTREQFEQDRQRYQAELDQFLAQGLTDGHPLVDRRRRRIATVDQVLADPRFGLGGCCPDHPGPLDDPTGHVCRLRPTCDERATT